MLAWWHPRYVDKLILCNFTSWWLSVSKPRFCLWIVMKRTVSAWICCVVTEYPYCPVKFYDYIGVTTTVKYLYFKIGFFESLYIVIISISFSSFDWWLFFHYNDELFGSQADVDGNGTIDYIEFITATMHMNRMEREDHLYKAFEYFDKDRSG